jgi:KDO2-lipid IV(A) lauroyltransferase
MTTLYRPLRIRELEPFIRQARERLGASMTPAGTGAVRALLTALSSGGMSAIAPDQDAGEGGGVFVPFFGVLANTMVFLPRLVRASGARVVMAQARRLPRGRGYHLEFLPPPEQLYAADLATAAAALNQGIESLVRRDPEQYMWCYDRYRIRPPGEPTLYPERRRYW